MLPYTEGGHINEKIICQSILIIPMNTRKNVFLLSLSLVASLNMYAQQANNISLVVSSQIAEKKVIAERPISRRTTTKATITNMKQINGTNDDFSPIFFENGILFCSNSRRGKAKITEEEKEHADLNLKFAPFDSTGSLTRPTSFSRRANSKMHEGPSCFSRGGDTMFLTRLSAKPLDIEKGEDKKEALKNYEPTLKIFIKAKDTSGNFVGDEVMPFESDKYHYCHPTLSADGRRLYFASNMPGGFGGLDIYVSRKLASGTWSQPMNLGARINTAGNEIFPFMSDEGTLYFSSNGRNAKREDLDIFRIEIEDKSAKVFPLAEPFNTEFDDFGIMFLPKSNTQGFFSSNRKGGAGGDDIYGFEFE